MLHKTIIAVLTFIIASGGTYSGYKVVENYDKYGWNFENNSHKVVEVIDGDTIKIASKNIGETITIRMLGIDAPERGQCGYEEAKEYLKQLIEGKEIHLEKDINKKDIFGRLLRYVLLENPNPEIDTIIINNKMAYMGWVFNVKTPKDTKYRDLFARSTDNARKLKKGIWGLCPELVSAKTKSTDRHRENDSQPTDPACTIKGNISEKGYGRLYFYKGCPNYERIKIDKSKGEDWFCTEEEAQKAGFTKSKSCSNTF